MFEYPSRSTRQPNDSSSTVHSPFHSEYDLLYWFSDPEPRSWITHTFLPGETSFYRSRRREHNEPETYHGPHITFAVPPRRDTYSVVGPHARALNRHMEVEVSENQWYDFELQPAENTRYRRCLSRYQGRLRFVVASPEQGIEN